MSGSIGHPIFIIKSQNILRKVYLSEILGVFNVKAFPVSVKQAISEEELIRLVQKDPKKEFAQLYERFYEPVLQFIYRRMDGVEEAYDIAAQVFVKVYLNINKYTYKGLPFAAWLYRIALNEVTQHYRKLSRSRTVTLSNKAMKSIAEESGSAEAELSACMAEAMQHLEEQDVQLIELRFFEGLPFAEVAEVLGITENNAKVRTYRMLERLKEVYIKVRKR